MKSEKQNCKGGAKRDETKFEIRKTKIKEKAKRDMETKLEIRKTKIQIHAGDTKLKFFVF